MSKAIIISDKPKWCALMMNGDKNIEVRTSKALATAIQKLIDEQGYADIYVYCTKDKEQLTSGYSSDIKGTKYFIYNDNEAIDYRGKVVFKFRCYKVEEIAQYDGNEERYFTKSLGETELFEKSCLGLEEMRNYIHNHFGYAIHISDLEIFDDPKELNDFYRFGVDEWANKHAGTKIGYVEFWNGIADFRLTKAPQNYCYVEI